MLMVEKELVINGIIYLIVQNLFVLTIKTAKSR